MSDFQFDTSGLDDYITSEMLETEGLWLENFPGGRAFKVRRAGGKNRKYARLLTAAVKPYRQQRGGLENLDPEVSDRVLRHVYARAIVVDWRGINDADGNPIPFSVEACDALFKALPELFRDIMTLASEASMFSEARVREAEEALGED